MAIGCVSGEKRRRPVPPVDAVGGVLGTRDDQHVLRRAATSDWEYGDRSSDAEVTALEMTEQEETEIRQYVESQTRDSANRVRLVQRVGRRRIAGHTHDLYDVWMDDADRWWVITGFTNLYFQDDFNDIDHAFTYHLGICALLRERTRVATDEESMEVVGRPWRRFVKAVDAMSEAEEAEDYQAVGIRCREALLALVREHSSAPWLGEPEEPPKAADFKGWVSMHSTALSSGRVRSFLRDLAERVWDLTVWLQHFSDATELDAEMVLEATAHFLRTFALAVRRFEAGSSARCPGCESYRLAQDGNVEERDGASGYASNDVCLACGWTSERSFEPYSAEWFERAADYLDTDPIDLGSVGSEEPQDG